MSYKWGSRKEDVRFAQERLMLHHDEAQSKPMGLREYVTMPEGTLKVEKSRWVIEIEEHLIEKHGSDKGQNFANKILSDFVIRDNTIH
jgi:hypothetical protein